MIRQGISDYISVDGIMDHQYDDHACQRYIYLHLGPIKKSIDLPKGQKEVEVDIEGVTKPWSILALVNQMLKMKVGLKDR